MKKLLIFLTLLILLACNKTEIQHPSTTTTSFPIVYTQLVSDHAAPSSMAPSVSSNSGKRVNSNCTGDGIWYAQQPSAYFIPNNSRFHLYLTTTDCSIPGGTIKVLLSRNIIGEANCADVADVVVSIGEIIYPYSSNDNGWILRYSYPAGATSLDIPVDIYVNGNLNNHDNIHKYLMFFPHYYSDSPGISVSETGNNPIMFVNAKQVTTITADYTAGKYTVSTDAPPIDAINMAANGLLVYGYTGTTCSGGAPDSDNWRGGSLGCGSQSIIQASNGLGCQDHRFKIQNSIYINATQYSSGGSYQVIYTNQPHTIRTYNIVINHTACSTYICS
jgi:hypothetical protein